MLELSAWFGDTFFMIIINFFRLEIAICGLSNILLIDQVLHTIERPLAFHWASTQLNLPGGDNLIITLRYTSYTCASAFLNMD